MTTGLTDHQLDEIEARTNAATTGPWTMSEDYSDVLTPDGDQLASYWNPTAETRNGEFIAHAREDVPALVAEIRRLQAELERRTEDAAFLERTTLPELRRQIEHHKAGKQRWRDRAEKAETRVRELERPDVEAARNEIRQSFAALIAQARDDRDYEGAFNVQCQLRDREEQWKREDANQPAA